MFLTAVSLSKSLLYIIVRSGVTTAAALDMDTSLEIVFSPFAGIVEIVSLQVFPSGASVMDMEVSSLVPSVLFIFSSELSTVAFQFVFVLTVMIFFDASVSSKVSA